MTTHFIKLTESTSKFVDVFNKWENDPVKKQGIKRIELGVFEFNKQAQKLYQKLGYKEIGRIENFTYWQGEMWTDIRMEKYV
ncbi:GNAT family N-acetyltransferase [Bacillus sp. FJAT-42315]|uniref:GNAT family N-acetyltransferase n=1 Tax=Bacillus sp. FJAT-42315 TaxID=2014077 RepID=UPI000C231B89|nr:GNAT family protein [Bacillus sp. FJAT-42315]